MAIARLVDVEIFKLRKRTLTWILLAVLIALIVLVYVLLWAVTETLASSATGGTSTLGDIQITNLENIRETIYLRQAVPFGLEMTRAIGLFLAVILAAACVGSEYDWSTIRPYLTATRTRAEYLQGKIIAVALLVLAGTAAGMVTALLTSAVITEIAGSSDYSFVDAGYIGDSVLSYGRTLLAICPLRGDGDAPRHLGPLDDGGHRRHARIRLRRIDYRQPAPARRRIPRPALERAAQRQRRHGDAGEQAGDVAADAGIEPARCPPAQRPARGARARSRTPWGR